MRTQNPPALKACRFDSDLGHHHFSASGRCAPPGSEVLKKDLRLAVHRVKRDPSHTTSAPKAASCYSTCAPNCEGAFRRDLGTSNSQEHHLLSLTTAPAPKFPLSPPEKLDRCWSITMSV